MALSKILLSLQVKDKQWQQTLSQQQELLLASQQISMAIAQAGITSCGKGRSLLGEADLISDPSQQIDVGPSLAVYGSQNPWPSLWGLTAPGSGKLIEGSPVMAIRSIKRPEDKLLQGAAAGSQWLSVQGPQTFAKGDVIVISDCQHLLINRVQNAKNNGDSQYLNMSMPLPFSFALDSSVSRYQFNAYYLGEWWNGKRMLPSLYLKNLSGQRLALFPGIADWQIIAIGAHNMLLSQAKSLQMRLANVQQQSIQFEVLLKVQHAP
jgi:hypothetical protein